MDVEDGLEHINLALNSFTLLGFVRTLIQKSLKLTYRHLDLILYKTSFNNTLN